MFTIVSQIFEMAIFLVFSQVQVSCDARNGVPFYLNVRDPARHIRIVQENKRFSDASIVTANDVGIDHKYTVSVPSVDDYFPVLRYKCSSELRPVPIVSSHQQRCFS